VQLLAVREEVKRGINVCSRVRSKRDSVYGASIRGNVAHAVHREGWISRVDSQLGREGMRKIDKEFGRCL
jgi:hypothetical protein